MGQKINPYLFRLGISQNWKSRWFPRKRDARFRLEEDVIIRRVAEKKIGQAGIVHINIERGPNNSYKVLIKAARPGLVIGRGGKGIEELSIAINKELRKTFKKRGEADVKFSLSLNVEELKRTEVSAQYIAQSIAWELEKRMRFRRVIKKHLENAMQNRDVQGVKVRVSGRLDGAEIARTEWLAKGKMPLHTLRANIDFGDTTAFNTYGTIGVRVWVYKGEVFQQDKNQSNLK